MADKPNPVEAIDHKNLPKPLPQKPGPTKPEPHPAFKGDRPEHIEPKAPPVPAKAAAAKTVATILLLLWLCLQPAAATSVLVTNDMGAPIGVALYTNAPTLTIAGLTVLATNASTTLTNAGAWLGVLLVNTNNNLAVVTTFAVWTSTNNHNASYLLGLGKSVYYNPNTVTVGTITNGGGGGGGGGAQAIPAPVAVWGGTNNPNGVITSGYGSLYNQFDATTGTNFVQQWVKQSATGSTNWAIVTTGGGSAGVTNLASPIFQTTTLTNTATGHAVALSQATGVLGQGLTVAGEVKATGGFETPGGGFQADSSGNVTALTLNGNGTGISNAPVSTTISNNILASAAAAASTAIVGSTNNPTSAFSALSFNGAFNGGGAGLTNLFAGTFVNVLQAGCTNDGVTDNTAVLNKLAGSGVTLFMPPGIYNTTNTIYLTNNTVIIGYGATLNNIATNIGTAGICNCFNTNCAVFGLYIRGNQYTNPPAWQFADFRGSHTVSNYLWFTDSGTAGLGYWQGNTARHSVIWSTDTHGTLENVSIDGWDGNGLLACSVTGQSAHDFTASVISGLSVSHCMVGIGTAMGSAFQNSFSTPWLTNFVTMANGTGTGNGNDAQYQVFSHCHVFECGIGIDILAANNCFDACNVDNNWVACYPAGSGAVSGVTGHGRALGCSFNHNYGIPVEISGMQSGFKWIGCAFRGNSTNAFVIYNCAEVIIRACELDGLPAITNTIASGNNYFLDNNYTGTWSTNQLSLSTNMVIAGNISSSVVGNTDGSSIGLGLYGNGASLSLSGLLTLTNQATAPAAVANSGRFWPSNTALYWVTPTHTNYVTGP